MTLPAAAAQAPASIAAGTQRRQLSTGICCPRPNSAANQPQDAAAAVDKQCNATALRLCRDLAIAVSAHSRWSLIVIGNGCRVELPWSTAHVNSYK